MTGVCVLDLDEIRQLIDPAQAITAVREALIAHGRRPHRSPLPQLIDTAGRRTRY